MKELTRLSFSSTAVNRELAQRLGLKVDRFAGPIVPIVYNLNLRDPAGYFTSDQVPNSEQGCDLRGEQPDGRGGKSDEFLSSNDRNCQ